MKKIIILVLMIFYFNFFEFPDKINLKGTYWVYLSEKWDIKNQDDDSQRIGSAFGKIIYFGDNNRFYYLTGLIDLFERNIIELYIYEAALGFYGTWRKYNKNTYEIKYKFLRCKCRRFTGIGLSNKSLKEYEKLNQVKIKIINNQFRVKFVDMSNKCQFFYEKELGVQVFDEIIGNYFGKEHTVNNINHAIKIKKKQVKENFGHSFSPDKKQIVMAQIIGDGLIKLAITDIDFKKKPFIRKRTFFNHIFIDHHIKKPDFIEWAETVVILKYERKRIKLFKNEKLLEINNITNDKKCYYDYLHLQLDQLYENMESIDQKKYLKLLKPYIGLRIDEKFFNNIKTITKKSWENIGIVFYKLISELNRMYADKLVFQIFERAYNEHYKIENNKVRFYW